MAALVKMSQVGTTLNLVIPTHGATLTILGEKVPKIIHGVTTQRKIIILKESLGIMDGKVTVLLPIMGAMILGIISQVPETTLITIVGVIKALIIGSRSLRQTKLGVTMKVILAGTLITSQTIVGETTKVSRHGVIASQVGEIVSQTEISRRKMIRAGTTQVQSKTDGVILNLLLIHGVILTLEILAGAIPILQMTVGEIQTQLVGVNRVTQIMALAAQMMSLPDTERKVTLEESIRSLIKSQSNLKVRFI